MQKNINYIKQTLTPIYGQHETSAFVRWIMHALLGYSSTDILMNSNRVLSEDITAEVKQIVERLKRFEPIQYILQSAEFYGLNLYVDPNVLIPRPETEELVSLIVNSKNSYAPKILDIGTGSGCIALSLKKAIPNADVWACDVSEAALSVAEKNARAHNLDVNFFRCNILATDTINEFTVFDIIVSNPPYVLQSEKKQMQENVLSYEPHLALFVEDDDPLLFYRAIALFAQKHLNSSGVLWFEINENKGKEVEEMLVKSSFCNVHIFSDIYGKHRFVKAEKLC